MIRIAGWARMARSWWAWLRVIQCCWIARPVTKTVRYRLMPASEASPRAMPKDWSVSMGEICARCLFLQMETRPAGSSLVHHRIGQGADALDLDGRGIAGLEPAGRGAGHADA